MAKQAVDGCTPWRVAAPVIFSASMCFLLVPSFRTALHAQTMVTSPGGSPAEPTHQDSAELHLGKGYADLKNDRYEAADREFRAALALDPQLILRARFPLAVALFELHKPEEARKEFEAVRSEAGDQPDITYYLGRLDLVEGNIDGAIRNLTEAATNQPFPDTAYYLGSAYLRKGELVPAENWLRRAAQLAPQDFRVQERLGLLYREAGRKEKSEKAFAQATELREHDAEVSRQRIACIEKLENGSLEQARPVCKQLYDPDDAERLTILGTIYGAHGDYEEALRPLRRAAELSPNSPQMQYNLALACFRLKRYEEARTALSGAVKQWPDLFQLNALFGVVLYRLSENHAAYQALYRAHELNPQDKETSGFLYEVSILLAQRHMANKQDFISLRYLRTASEVHPYDPEPHRLMAEIYRLKGQQERASEESREAEHITSLNTINPK